MLVGRERERNAIEGLLVRAREGEAGALVLRGEAGVGKTLLLEHALAVASGMPVVRATGIELETQLEFSGLLEICRPLLADLDVLPERQSDALRVALGLATGDAPDRFAVGAATLGLLAAAAERDPLLVLVDDAHWLDHASTEALVFAARRLLADPVAFLIATREDGFRDSALPEIRLEGLDLAAARDVVAEAAGVDVPPTVVAALHAETGGNPLALIEIPGRLTRAQLEGRAPLDGPLPVTEGIERAYAERIARLPEAARRALGVLAAADQRVAPAVAALSGLGLGPDDLAPGEEAGLVEISGGEFRFRHPLLRAAAYHGLSPAFRRDVHRSLADALDGAGDRERRAWHLAEAALGFDAAAADALADAASAARGRGGDAAAAAALERAARLTADRGMRVHRLAEAADAAWSGGSQSRAVALVEEALAEGPDDRVRARLLGLSGRVEFQSGSLERARALLLESAALLESHDRREAVMMLGFAEFTLHGLARVDEAITLARRALELSHGQPDEIELRAEYHLGRALVIAGRTSEGEPLLQRSVDRLLAPLEPSRIALQRAAIALAVLDRADEAAPLVRRVVDLARAAGPMTVVYALSLEAQVAIRQGRWRAASAVIDEGRALADDLGQANVAATFHSFGARIGAARGDAQALQRHEGRSRAASEASGNLFELLQLDAAAGLLALGRDDLDTAVRVLGPCVERAHELGICDRDLSADADLVEALVRLGRREEAVERLGRWVELGAATAGRWAPPLVERCRGLVAADGGFAEPFARSLALHERLGDPYAEARTRLALGERLRRSGERVDARRELGAALGALERLDAEAWAGRARRELRASGMKLRSAADAGDELTPQELQVALQVAEGKSNKDVAAALFLSPKTVEFHLGRIYRKLSISSRAELVRHFASAEPAAVAGPG